MTPEDAAAWASTITTARRARRLLQPITDERPLELDEAYAIQALVDQDRLAAGEHAIGWKLGYTSEAMRREMHVDRPNRGTLTDAMLLPSNAVVGDELLQPRVEPEIGLRLRRRVRSPATDEDVHDAVAEAVACLEIVDSVWAGYRFRVEDNTADGSSAARVVVGDPVPLDALDRLSVVLRRNGEEVGRGVGAAAMGHPIRALRWLVDDLGRRGMDVPAGSLVITGGLTRTAELGQGDLVAATFGEGVDVRVRRAVANRSE